MFFIHASTAGVCASLPGCKHKALTLCHCIYLLQQLHDVKNSVAASLAGDDGKWWKFHSFYYPVSHVTHV